MRSPSRSFHARSVEASDTVWERADEAHDALFRHPERTLLPWYRYALYAALAEDDADRGDRARGWLDILAARKVLFCWQPLAQSARHPIRTQPAALLILAADTISGVAAPALAAAELSYALAYSDVAGEPAGSPHYPAWCVYEAAARALHSAVSAVSRASGALSSREDAAGYAAIAVSGRGDGRAERQEQDAEDARLRRAVFWEWWLREALPHAIERARQPG